MASLESDIAEFRAACEEGLPYCTGSVILDESSSSLFYRVGDSNAGVVDFLNPTDGQLEGLTQACDAATFGRDQKDVLDESYRKAWKMDANRFSTQFSPITSNIMETIQTHLVQQKSEDGSRSVHVELYKLNVYGPGSFFKAHVDTPRASNMFGSLVVILPTPHEGGDLIFRHQGEEWTFDSAPAVSTNNDAQRHAAFVAFFSDVEHEVSIITSGYRVTLTYNLYLVDAQISQTLLPMPVNATMMAIENTFRALLLNPGLLPGGGYVGFGLSHKYPFNRENPNLLDVRKMLKGLDRILLSVADALKLNPKVRAIYREEGRGVACLVKEFAVFGEGQCEERLMDYLQVNHGGVLVHDEDGIAYSDSDSDSEEDEPRVKSMRWLKPLNKTNSVSSPYVAYGNEASLEYAYGDVCLVVKLEAYRKRVKKLGTQV